jgi:hypothetical protein
MLTPSQFTIDPSGRTRIALDVVGAPRDQESWVVGVRLPGAVRIRHAHEEHAPVAVDVLAVEPVLGLVTRVWADARAAEAAVREPRLGAVRVDARHDVERPRVHRVSDAGIVGVEEAVEEVESGCRAGELHRVDLGMDEDGRLLDGPPGVGIRDRTEPDVAIFVRLPDRLEAEERGELGRPCLERLGQLGVRVEAVELDAHEGAA